MSERCERCRKGYAGPPPRDDVEWLTRFGGPEGAGTTTLRTARCTRCGAFLLDRYTTDPARDGAETHDICVVHHDAARAAVLERTPLALAAVSPQVRRRHMEALVSAMRTDDRSTLERIERGAVECTEAFRGLVTRALALATELPSLPGSRPKPEGESAGPARGPLELPDGSRVVVDASRPRLTLLRMRGDAVAWRVELATAGREAVVARVQGRDPLELVVLVGPAGGAHGELFVVDGDSGTVRGPGAHGLRAAPFEARALPSGCIFVATYQRYAIAREDATVVWEGSAAAFPLAVAYEQWAVVVDAPWRLVAVALPSGAQRWSIPVDRGAALAPSGDGYLLLTTVDSVARLDVRGAVPRLVWLASGVSVLPLAGGGAALVRERWEKSLRRVECVTLGADGRRLFAVSRPEATKAPVAELGPGVLLYRSPVDVAVSANDRVVYAVSAPDGRPISVVVDAGGVWVEYEGVVDRIDATGQRVGRWRVRMRH